MGRDVFRDNSRCAQFGKRWHIGLCKKWLVPDRVPALPPAVGDASQIEVRPHESAPKILRPSHPHASMTTDATGACVHTIYTVVSLDRGKELPHRIDVHGGDGEAGSALNVHARCTSNPPHRKSSSNVGVPPSKARPWTY